MVQARRTLISLISSILLINQTSARLAYKHEARPLELRQLDIRPYNGPPGGETHSGQVLAFITPSPGASPIPISTQSQEVTSYVPQFTLCELPPVAEVLVTPISTTTTAPYKNFTVSIPSGNGTCTTIYSPTVTKVCATILTGLAEKYTVSECEQEITFSTIFGYVLETAAPAVSTISVSVAPALQSREEDPGNMTQLGNSTINPGGPIDNSSIPLNSSTLLNATSTTTPTIHLTTITPPPQIQTLTTYLLAPWTELALPSPPSSVTQKICHASNSLTSCILEYQSYITTTLTLTTSTTTQINLLTTISGPSQILVETFRANISDVLTTFSLSTSMAVLWEVEVESTVAVTGSSGAGVAMSTTEATEGAGVMTGPTVYQTRTLVFASETGTPLSTSTTTLRITRTMVAGTTTVTLPTTLSSDTTDMAAVSYTSIPASVSSAPAVESVFTAPAGQNSIDAASVLGLEGK